MPFTLATPAVIGSDLRGGIVVDELEIQSIALNLSPVYTAKGTAVLSITLVHPASGWSMNITYRDASALAFWGAINGDAAMALISSIWAKLQADGKLPAGTCTPVIPELAAAQAAVDALTKQSGGITGAAPAVVP